MNKRGWTSSVRIDGDYSVLDGLTIINHARMHTADDDDAWQFLDEHSRKYALEMGIDV